jgi:hypothetical protein
MVIRYKHTPRKFHLTSARRHLGVCTGTYHVGVLPPTNPKYDARDTIIYRFEVTDEPRTWTDATGKQHTAPATIDRTYTYSFNKGTDQRRDLEMWRGAPFTDEELADLEVTAFLGKPVQLDVIHNKVNDRTFANIAAIMPAPNGAAPKPLGKLEEFDVDHWNDAAYAALSADLKKKVDNRIIPGELPQKTEPDETGDKPPDAEGLDDAIPF